MPKPNLINMYVFHQASALWHPFPFTHSTHTNPLNLVGVCPGVVTNANIMSIAQVTFDTGTYFVQNSNRHLF